MNNYPRDNETSPVPDELLNPFWIGVAILFAVYYSAQFWGRIPYWGQL